MFPDDKFIETFLDGDPEAVNTVLGWATEIVRHGVWDFDNVEDAVQTTMLAVVKSLRAGRFTGGDFRAYVRRIAKNICISIYRRTRSMGSQTPLDCETNISGVDRNTMNPENTIVLGRILDELSESCRKLINMAYIEGHSRQDISRMLGISEGAVRVRLYRCISNARELFKIRSRPV